MTRRHWISLLLALSMLTLPMLSVWAQEPRPLNDEMLQAELSTYIQSALETYSVPGAAVALVQRSKVVFAEGFGVREPDGTEPVDAQTLFHLGTMENSLSTMLVATLVDDELLTWDTPLAEIYEGFTLADADMAEKMRVRDLLGMTAALPRRDLLWVHPDLSAEDMIASLAEAELLTEPEPQFIYDQLSFHAGAYISAAAAGGEYQDLQEAYIDLMQKRVFDPMYMRTATFSVDTVRADANYALPTDALPGGELFTIDYPVDGASASVREMANFLITNIKGGIVSPLIERVVSSESLAETHRVHVDLLSDSHVSDFMPGAEYFGYGMGWYVVTINGVDVILCPGNSAGFTGLMAFVPEYEAGIVILSNRNNADPFTFSIFHYMYALMSGTEFTAVYELEDNYAQEQATLAGIAFQTEFTFEDVEEYLGSYGDGWQIELRSAPDALPDAAADTTESTTTDEATTTATTDAAAADSTAIPTTSGTLWLVQGERAWQLFQVPRGFMIVTGTLWGGAVRFVEDDENPDRYSLVITTPYGETGTFGALE